MANLWVLVAMAALTIQCSVAQLSCLNRCDEEYDVTRECHCDFLCRKFENCCDDFIPICSTFDTCEYRCGEPLNATVPAWTVRQPCRCNDGCTENCCKDFRYTCAPEGCDAAATIAASAAVGSSTRECGWPGVTEEECQSWSSHSCCWTDGGCIHRPKDIQMDGDDKVVPCLWDILFKLTEKNRCMPDSCKNGATCISGFTSFKCQCGEGWTGPDCSVQIV